MAQFRVDESGSDEDALAIWSLYETVFADYSDCRTWRDAVWDRHRTREGFRLVRAYDGDTLLGFAYGYTGQRGQWWTDHALTVLGPEVGASWLGGHFEVVSIGVAESARRRSIGRGLLRHLCSDLPHERLVLMTTADASDPARCLYSTEGWQVLGPGIGDATVIMGKRAPLASGT